MKKIYEKPAMMVIKLTHETFLMVNSVNPEAIHSNNDGKWYMRYGGEDNEGNLDPE